MGKFGWSLPPGVTDRMIDEAYGFDQPCEVCAGNPELDNDTEGGCICPECPVCGDYGNPDCYEQGHLMISEAQKAQKEKFEKQWEEDTRAEADRMYEDYKEAESIFGKVGTVVARKCGCCGHHEIGVENEASQYYPLREGMKVEIIEED